MFLENNENYIIKFWKKNNNHKINVMRYIAIPLFHENLLS